MKQDKSKYIKYSNINFICSNYWKQRAMKKSFRKLEKQKTTFGGTNLRTAYFFLMQSRKQKEIHFKNVEWENKTPYQNSI